MPEKSDQKLFSIIIATYNCGRKIENTLNSILTQNRDLFELFVIDGDSNDDTVDILKRFEGEFTLVSEKDEGVYDAYNKGIDLASGKYLYFIGAGDCLKPGILEEIKSFLPPDAPTLVYGKCYFVKNKTQDGKEFNSKLFVRDNICHQGIFYHRNIFQILGKYELRYKILADWFFNLKCFINDDINKIYIDLVIADFEQGGLSAEIKRDKLFVKEFPHFIKKQFGLKNYLKCKAFLFEPHVFNYISAGQYESLARHIYYNKPFFIRLSKFIKEKFRKIPENKLHE